MTYDESTDQASNDPRPLLAADPDLRRWISRGLVVLTLVVLAIGVISFLSAAGTFIEVWFREQYVPVAGAFGSAVVIAVCLYVLRLLLLNQRA